MTLNQCYVELFLMSPLHKLWRDIDWDQKRIDPLLTGRFEIISANMRPCFRASGQTDMLMSKTNMRI